MFWVFFHLANPWQADFDGEPILQAPTNMKHLAMSASPTNHGVDKLWPTKWCCQTGKQIAKGCVVLWEKFQWFDGVCQVSGTWGLRFPRAKNIYKWFQLHHPERMLVCHAKSSMCFQHFLWNWYQSWSQCHVRKEFQALTPIRNSASYFLRCFFLILSATKVHEFHCCDHMVWYYCQP